MFKKSVFISITFLMIGCSTEIKTIRLSENILVQKSPGKLLLPKNKTTAHVGEVMFTAGEYSKQASTIKSETFTILESHDIYAKHRRKTITYHLKPMVFFLYHENDFGSYYKAIESIQTSEPSSYAFIGLYVPKTTNEATEFFWNWNPINNPNFYQIKLTQPIKGIKDTKTQYLNDSYSSKTPMATVTYAGVSRGQIRFTYNEFTNNGYIKPSFTQDVYLDYKPNETYSYKSAVFKVYKADSSHINFEIIKPLN